MKSRWTGFLRETRCALPQILRMPEIIARIWAATKPERRAPEREVVETITALAPLWEELFPAEQARIVRLLYVIKN